MSNLTELTERNGAKGWLYYASFPLDLFAPNDADRLLYQQTKLEELWPIFSWLLPGLVILSAFTSFSGFGLLAFYGLEATILAVLSHFHLQLRANQTVEVALNAWLAMALYAVLLAVGAWALGAAANPSLPWS